ncbi:MAG: methyltransferase domain-containing protein, partial [Hyphococcus sp.]
ERLKPETFDAVLGFNLLHLLHDAQAAVRRVHALLKPGGLFISKTVCLSERGGALRLLIPVMRFFGKAPHVAFLDTPGLDAMVAGAGFELIETGYYPKAAAARFIVARKTPDGS